MSGFLYFIPGESRSITLEELKTLGLGYAFESPEDLITREVTGSGPCNLGAGVIVARQRNVKPSDLGYFVESQSWEMAAGLKNICLGYITNSLPTPESLERETCVSGYYAKLGDEQSWLIPVARAAGENGNKELIFYNNLPNTTTVNIEGDFEPGGVLPKHEKLWEVACAFWDSLLGAMTEAGGGKNIYEFDFKGKAEAALIALNVNYPIGKPEIVCLGLFNDQSIDAILNVLVDIPSINEFNKKKQQVDTSSIVGGPLGATRGIAPV